MIFEEENHAVMLELGRKPIISKRSEFEKIKLKKINVVFPLTRPTLSYCPDPTDFIGKLVDTELKG